MQKCDCGGREDMRKDSKRRMLGKLVFKSPKPYLSLVQPVEQRPAVKPEPSPKVREMLREMNRRRGIKESPNRPDVA